MIHLPLSCGRTLYDFVCCVCFAAELTVILVDVNDRAPEFQPSNVYHARISEASQPGIVVKQATSTYIPLQGLCYMDVIVPDDVFGV